MHCVLGRHKAEVDAWNKAVESDNRRAKFEINENLIQADQKGSVCEACEVNEPRRTPVR